LARECSYSLNGQVYEERLKRWQMSIGVQVPWPRSLLTRVINGRRINLSGDHFAPVLHGFVGFL
jgi:hypothetical protein